MLIGLDYDILNNQLYYILILALSVFTNSCIKQDEESSLSKNKIISAINIGFYNPEEAEDILDSIDYVSLLDTESKMYYSIADMRAKYNLGYDISNDSSIYNAVKYFEKTNNAEYAGLANYYASIHSRVKKNKQKEIEYLRRALPYTEVAKDSILESRILFNIGALFDQQEYSDSAAIYFQKAINCFLAPNKECIKAYRRLSFINYLNRDYVIALYNIERAEELAEKYNDMKEIYYANEMYGIIYYEYPKYELSSRFFHKYLEQSHNEEDSIRTMFNLARLYYRMEKYDSTSYYINWGLPNILNLNNNYTILSAYNTTKEYYLKKGDNRNFIKYTDLYDDMSMKIRNSNAKRNILEANSKAIESIQKDKDKHSQIKLFIYMIIAFIAIITFIIIFSHNKYKKREKLIIDEKMKDIKSLKKQLKMLENNVSNYNKEN